jgi:hypothetical protein
VSCPRDPSGVHVTDWSRETCIRCGAAVPKSLVEVPHPLRAPIRPVAGAGAYGRTAEKQAAANAGSDVARRRAGDDS